MTNSSRLIVAALLGAAALPSVAEEAKGKPAIEVSPVVLDSTNGAGTTLGLEYAISGSFPFSFGAGGPADFSKPISDASFGGAEISYKAAGTVAAEAERNPKNFLEFMLDGKLLYAGSMGTVKGGAFLKYEADQSFKNEQAVYGARATWAKYDFLVKNAIVALDLNYGRVDPKDDAARKSALGSATLEKYYRWDVEVLYILPLAMKVVPKVEFNYRYFKENSAPAAIKNAGTDVHRLGTVYFRLPHNMFVAYSYGRLPFDRKDDKIFEIGFSYDLKGS